MLPSTNEKIQDGDDWVMEYDRRTGHFYYFNVATGESRWAEEHEGSGSFGSDHAEAEETQLTAPSGAGELGQLKRRGGKGSQGEDGGKQKEGEDDDDDDEEDHREPHVVMLETSRKGAEIYRRTQPVIMAFTVMFYFHGCCCEGPMAAIEGLVRGPVYMACSALLLLRAGLTCRRAHLEEAGAWLREGLLFVCAGIVLLIPAASLMAYRNFHPDADEWELRGIPTCLGLVDPRRFWVFSGGQGAMASNAVYDVDAGSLDSLGKRILHPPKSMVIPRTGSMESDGAEEDDEEGQGGAKQGAKVPKGPKLERRVQVTQTGKAYQQI